MLLAGTVAMGAVVVLGGVLFSLGSASKFDGLKVRVVTSLDPPDRTHLASLVRNVRVAGAKLGTTIDQAVDRGVNV